MNADKRLLLKQLVSQNMPEHLHPLASRIHPWPQLATRMWIKRDDELSCTISGSKLRKLLALRLAWQRQEASLLLAAGGWNSNHLPALLQQANEAGIACEIWTWGRRSASSSNAMLSQLLMGPQHRHKELGDRQPANLNEQLEHRLAELRAESQMPYLIYEGARQPDAIWGGLSLALEIANQSLAEPWTDIFVDAGTGMTAIGLCVGLAVLEMPLTVHVVLMAGTEVEFRRDLQAAACMLRASYQLAPATGLQVLCHRPPTAVSFGASNRRVFNIIREMAQSSGVILDPIYTAKLALCVRELIEHGLSLECGLLIHSGGAWANHGFANELLKD